MRIHKWRKPQPDVIQPGSVNYELPFEDDDFEYEEIRANGVVAKGWCSNELNRISPKVMWNDCVISSFDTPSLRESCDDQVTNYNSQIILTLVVLYLVDDVPLLHVWKVIR